MPLKVLISGPAGSGKTSVIEELVRRHGFATADVGQVFRARALAKGLTISEYDKLIENNPDEDRAMEADFRKLVEHSERDIIVSWRMGFHILPSLISIRLDVTPELAGARIFAQKRHHEQVYHSVAEVIASNAERTARHRERMLKIYGADFTDKRNYRHIIDTNGHKVPDTADAIEKLLLQYGFTPHSTKK